MTSTIRPGVATRSVAAVICALALALLLAVPSGAAAAKPQPPRAYWGAQIGSHLTGTEAPWDMNAVTKFEGMAGKRLSLVSFALPFANCESNPCTFLGFPTAQFQAVRQHGSIPFFSWASQGTPPNINQPNFQLSDVIAGTYDSYIQSFATAAKNWGHPFFLRFNFEMNGNWFPWSEGVNGNQPGESVAAWRHVHDIFTSVGATNANWVWCPYVNSAAGQDINALYPGDAYVDWTCLDGFNWGTGPNSATGVWRSFDFLYNPFYHQITDTIAPTKPMVIGEISSSEIGGSKSGWIHNLFMHLPVDYPKIRGLVWFEKLDNNMDWPIETSSSSTSSFATGIRSSTYATNAYGRLNTSTIQPPGG
jgi:hypothetical protein